MYCLPGRPWYFEINILMKYSQNVIIKDIQKLPRSTPKKVISKNVVFLGVSSLKIFSILTKVPFFQKKWHIWRNHSSGIIYSIIKYIFCPKKGTFCASTFFDFPYLHGLHSALYSSESRVFRDVNEMNQLSD